MRGKPSDGETNPDADLREELQSMEAKVRKMRETRNSLREQGKAIAKKRDAVQDQYKEHREKLTLMKAELDAIHAERNLSTVQSETPSTRNSRICFPRSKDVAVNTVKRNQPPPNILNSLAKSTI